MNNLDKIIDLAKNDKIEELKGLLINLTKDEDGFNPIEYKLDENYQTDTYKIVFGKDGMNLLDPNWNSEENLIHKCGTRFISIDHSQFYSILASQGLKGEIIYPNHFIAYYIDDIEGTIQISLKAKNGDQSFTVKDIYTKGSFNSLRETFINLLDDIWKIYQEYYTFAMDSISEYISGIEDRL